MGYFKIFKSLDAFKLPVTFYLNRRNKKKDKKIYMSKLGSVYGFWITLAMIVLILIYLFYLIDLGIIKRKLDKYNAYNMSNDYSHE